MGTATHPHLRPRPQRRPRHLAVAVIGVVLLALTGCSGDGDDASLKAAQLAVTSKEKALTEAQDAATKAAAEFCAASATYVTAVDRYGDVLNATAPTVGDVRMAGSDLAKPAEDAANAAQAVADSRAAVATAEQELAEAQATLATAQASAAGTTPPSPSPSKTPSPTPTPASVTRVQEAESELAAAQAGITDQTPLAQAAEQFNAAAVAVEMAWLQLIGDSGCLSDAQQEKAAKAVETYTTTLQTGARRCRLLRGGGRRRLRAENGRRRRGPAEGQRAAADRDARQGDREGAADRARGQGRSSRSGGDGVDSSRAADPQAGRLLGRTRRRRVDRRPDRRPGGPPEGLGCQGHGDRRRGHRRSPREGHRGCRPVGESQPVAVAVAVADCRHSGAHGVELTPEGRLKPKRPRLAETNDVLTTVVDATPGMPPPIIQFCVRDGRGPRCYLVSPGATPVDVLPGTPNT